MGKKGLLKYAEDGGIADDSGDKPKESSATADEMLCLELFEQAFSPPYGGEKTEIERKRGQLRAFGKLLEHYRKRG